jgi:Tol biopolymer transport system component
MPTERFERHIGLLLEDLAETRTPEYFDDLLWQTAHTSQRPAWTSFERWLPVIDTVRRPVVAPMPWRPFVVLALIVVALLVSIMLAGSRQKPPPIIGPAANGLVAHSEAGDIYTYDPRTGQSRAIVTGPEEDVDPIFSEDGASILFQRRTSPDSGDVYIARTDGSHLRRLTSQPLGDIWSYQLSPDGDSVAIVGSVQSGTHALFVANSDGSTIRNLDMGIVIGSARFRPTGSDILFVGAAGVDGAYSGLYLVDPDGTNRRTLLQPKAGQVLDGEARWSPDGTRIAFSRFEESVVPQQLRVHVMDADATHDTVVGHQDGAWLEGWPVWSPDGQRLAIERNTGKDGDWSHPRQPVILSLGSASPEVLVRFAASGSDAYEWSPDGTSILEAPRTADGRPDQQVMWDPDTGELRPAPWNATSYPAWQRVAP